MPRGEIVVVVGPPSRGDETTATGPEALDNVLRALLTSHSVKDAAKLASAETGRPRREVYSRAVELAKDIQ